MDPEKESGKIEAKDKGESGGMNDKSKFPEVTRGERTKAIGRVVKPVLKLTGYYTDSN